MSFEILAETGLEIWELLGEASRVNDVGMTPEHYGQTLAAVYFLTRVSHLYSSISTNFPEQLEDARDRMKGDVKYITSSAERSLEKDAKHVVLAPSASRQMISELKTARAAILRGCQKAEHAKENGSHIQTALAQGKHLTALAQSMIATLEKALYRE